MKFKRNLHLTKCIDFNSKKIDTNIKFVTNEEKIIGGYLQMANIVNKALELFGFNAAKEEGEDIDDIDEVIEEEQDQEQEETKTIFGKKAQKQNSSKEDFNPVKVVIMQPTTTEEAGDICLLLREKKSVIINLEFVNKDVARRIIDIISGGVTVLDAHMQKISNAIFLIAPKNYDIDYDLKDDSRKIPSVSSWLKNSG